jgi:hypothetical protein
LGKGFVGGLEVNLVCRANIAGHVDKVNNPSTAETSLEVLMLNPSIRGHIIGSEFRKGTGHLYFTLSAFLPIKVMHSAF